MRGQEGGAAQFCEKLELDRSREPWSQQQRHEQKQRVAGLNRAPIEQTGDEGLACPQFIAQHFGQAFGAGGGFGGGLPVAQALIKPGDFVKLQDQESGKIRRHHGCAFGKGRRIVPTGIVAVPIRRQAVPVRAVQPIVGLRKQPIQNLPLHAGRAQVRKGPAMHRGFGKGPKGKTVVQIVGQPA